MLEVVHEGAVGLAASNVSHGADELRVVVCPSRVVVDSVVRYRGWWFPGVGSAVGVGGACACGAVAAGPRRLAYIRQAGCGRVSLCVRCLGYTDETFDEV